MPSTAYEEDLDYDVVKEIEDIVVKIERWLAATGMKESRLGTLAAANPKAMNRIRLRTATIETFLAVYRYICEHPAGNHLSDTGQH